MSVNRHDNRLLVTVWLPAMC